MSRRHKPSRGRNRAAGAAAAQATVPVLRRISVPTRLPKPCGGQVVRAGLPVLRARYDAAQTTDENRRYCGNADALSVSAADRVAICLPAKSMSRLPKPV